MTLPMFDAVQEQITSDDRYTPPWIFEELGITFDLDVAAPEGGVPWIPAKRFYTKADDGLAQPWDGIVWCNPPFSDPTPWLQRMVSHGNGVFMGPISANAKWCGTAYDQCGVFTHLVGIRFVHENGEHRTLPTATGLFGFGEVAVNAIITSDRFVAMRRVTR